MPERVVGEGLEQPARLVGHERRELGRGLGAGDLGQGTRVVKVEEPAALVAKLVPRGVAGLSRGDGDEEPPKVVAAIQALEPAGGCSPEEAIEDAERDVFAVGRSPRGSPQSPVC